MVTATPGRNPGLERLVQPLADRHLQRDRRDVGHGLLRRRRRRTPGPTRRTPRSRAPASIAAGNTTVKVFSLSTTPRGRRELRPRAARPTRTAGTTTRSSSRSPERIATSGVDTLRGAADVFRAGRRERVGQRLLHDRAGNTTDQAFGLSYDATGPVVTATPSRLRIRMAGTTMRSRSASRARMRRRAWIVAFRRRTTPALIRRMRPFPVRAVTGRGTRRSRSSALSYDATAPTVTGASASRGPDHAGWYNHALSIAFSGGGRDLGHRFVHAGELLRPGLCQRLGLRHLP